MPVPRLLWPAVAAALLAARPAAAQHTWAGPVSGSAAWNNPANWSGGVPSSGTATTVAFTGSLGAGGLTVAQDVTSPFQLNALALGFNGAGLTFTQTGGTLAFAPNGAIQPTVTASGSADTRLRNPVTVATNSFTLTVGGVGAGRTVLDGPVSGFGAVTVSQTGGGVYFTRPNAYQGTTRVNAGSTLVLAAPAAVGRQSPVVIDGTVTAAPSGGGLPPGVTAGNYTQRFASLNGAATGQLALGSAAVVTGFNNTSALFAGQISGSGAVVKVGLNTLFVSGTNSYTGPTLVEWGSVQVSGRIAASSGVSVAAGTGFTIDELGGNQDRVGDAATVTLRGGRLFTNQGNEDVGRLSAPVGAGTLTVPSGETLRFTDYQPGPAATVNVDGSSGVGVVEFRTTAPPAVNGIVPSMTAGGPSEVSLAKVDASRVVPMAVAEYGSLAGGGPTTNARVTGAATVGTQTVNALTLAGGAGYTVTVTGSLTLGAGALLSGTLGTPITVVGPGSVAFGAGGSGAAYVTTSRQLVLDAPVSAAHFVAAALGGTSGITVNRPVTPGAGGIVAVNVGLVTVNNNGTTTTGGFVNAGTYRVMTGATLNIAGVTAGLDLGAGQRLEGNGMIQGGTLRIGTGAVVAPTALPGPGVLDTGNMVWQSGGAYEWRLNSVTGELLGQFREYTQSYLRVTGQLNLSGISPANPFVVRPISLTADHQPGPVSDFDPTQPYQWLLVSDPGGITGFSADKFTADASGFANPTNGTFSVTLGGGSTLLLLEYTPVPEPGAAVGVAAVGLAVLGRRFDPRRRRPEPV